MHPELEATVSELRKGQEQHLLLTGLNASVRAIVLGCIVEKLGQQARTGKDMLVLMDSQDEAQYLYADLQAIEAENIKIQVLLFPSARRRRQGADEAMIIQRTETLTALSAESERQRIVVSYPEAITEGVPKPQQLTQNTIRLRTEQTMPISRLTEMLQEQGFERMDFVYEPGQYAVRGGIVVFKNTAKNVRIFGKTTISNACKNSFKTA